MPYLSEKIKISGTKHDRRIKLTQEERIEIFNSNLSQRKLAAIYNVSRSLIRFIKDPEKAKRNYQLRLQRGGSKQYYNKEYSTLKTREHRQYKQQLFINNEISN